MIVARDPFGLRPVFYARTPGGVVWSESLEDLIAKTGVNAEELDERAVGDYLENGVYADAEATVFRHVRRVPPGHALGDDGTIRRIWSLPRPAISNDAPVRLETALRDSIRDRLTAPSAVVFMSGGLDSTTLAALAREVAPEVKLLAMTSVYRSRIDDVEERYAIEAARSIGIEQRSFPLDDYHPLQALDEGIWTADPGALLTAPVSRAVHAEAARHAPVAMHGHPADALFSVDLRAYLRSLGPLQLFASLIRYTLVKRRPPYFFLRPQRDRVAEPRPRWLLARGHERSARHPLEAAEWSSYYEWAHPSVTRAPIELVYPWLDERVVEAALAMPPVPWLIDKHVVRELLRGRVSETVRRRRKTFVRADPWSVALPVARSLEIEAASLYIDPRRFAEALRGATVLSDKMLRAVAFEYWLRELPRQIDRFVRKNVLK